MPRPLRCGEGRRSKPINPFASYGKLLQKSYDPNEPRDPKGEWTEGGGAGKKGEGWRATDSRFEEFRIKDDNGKTKIVRLRNVGPGPFGKNTIMGEEVEPDGEVKAKYVTDPKDGQRKLQTYGHILDLSLVVGRRKMRVWEHMKYGESKARPEKDEAEHDDHNAKMKARGFYPGRIADWRTEDGKHRFGEVKLHGGKIAIKSPRSGGEPDEWMDIHEGWVPRPPQAERQAISALLRGAGFKARVRSRSKMVRGISSTHAPGYDLYQAGRDIALEHDPEHYSLSRHNPEHRERMDADKKKMTERYTQLLSDAGFDFTVNDRGMITIPKDQSNAPGLKGEAGVKGESCPHCGDPLDPPKHTKKNCFANWSGAHDDKYEPPND